MKAWTLFLGSVALLGVAASPLNAAQYVSRVSSGYSPFGFYGFGAYPTSTIPSTSSSTATKPSTLQTSSCLYNSCGGNVPGTTTNTTPSVASSFTNQPASSYNYSSFYGSVTRYSVFGMYSFRRSAFGGTQQPSLGGGLTPGNVLGDPLANPEPTTVVLFGAGLLALGWARRRASRNS